MFIRIALALCVITTSASAQQAPQTTFRDVRGNTLGTATTSGNQTTFRDSRGRTIGTSTTDSTGNTVLRDAQGNTTGTLSHEQSHSWQR